MELPIDHFRLLGVSPASDAQNVLHTLQHRLENPPDQGFTLEAIQARAALLEASADVLSDPQRRQAYEVQLMEIEQGAEGEGVAAGLDVAPSKELGGLMLLLEAGMPHETFEATVACLQPPQAPALGSGREADLSLLAAVSCRAAAMELQGQRHYEAAAQLLQQGLQHLQRMGQLPEQRLQLSNDLQALLPFRVLGLVSRPLTASQERAEGLELLESLVKRRGGLEGEDDPTLPREDFQAFIKQIRLFLTVQEQVDLFDRWAKGGSGAADFLASYALTASGFAQRKPERIAAARDRLEGSPHPGIQPMQACLDLLLGEVEPAMEHFSSGAGPELRAWAAEQADEPLAQLCAYCRDWLARDVLPGYRDIEVDADLEAYFADRDVQAYVDQQDRHQARDQGPGWTMPELEPGEPHRLEGLSPPAPVPLPKLAVSRQRPRATRPLALAGVALAAGAALITGLWLVLRPRPAAHPPAPTPISGQAPTKASPPPPTSSSAGPLTSATPNQQEVRRLLEGWLAARSALLGGRSSQANLDQIARPALVSFLRSEARELKARGEQQQMQARIQTFQITSQSPRRIEAEAQIDYSEELRAGDKVIKPRSEFELRNIYVFARDGGTWKLADFHTRR